MLTHVGGGTPYMLMILSRGRVPRLFMALSGEIGRDKG